MNISIVNELIQSMESAGELSIREQKFLKLAKAFKQLAAENVARLGMAERVTLLLSDWAAAVEGRFDLILCNPPYIEDGAALMPDVALHEPAGALFGGADGLAPYRLLLPQVPALLALGGVALFEFGVGQEDALLAMAADAGLRAGLRADLSGRARALVVTG